ncbi:ABC transporter ATP-binding protein [Alkalibaculum sporogenes]|nr:ABC transporter ATP-binding protein [Alkalibaculum sporogenes]
MNIVVQNLGFNYPNGKSIFNNLNFTINKSKVLSILGPNGVGKTTLLGCIARLYLPSQGDVFFDGKSYLSMTQCEIAQNIGYVPQIIVPAFNYSVIDYIVTGCAPSMKVFQKPKKEEYDRAWCAVKKLKLEHIAHKSIMQISGGERQQAAIARVITQKPSFILLDEPASHLDMGNQMKLLEILNDLAQEDYGIVMTTHNPDHVFILDDQVAVLRDEGNLISGKSRDILNEEFLYGLYGSKIKVLNIKELGRMACIAQGIL